MSLKMDSFPCPKCGQQQQFTIWRYLNIRDNPEALPGVLDGSIFDYTCSNCGISVRVGYPLVYHDPDRKLIVVMLQDREEEQLDMILAQLKSADVFSPNLSGQTLRGVTQPPELAEKVLISLESLDDRVIEVYKSWLRNRYMEDHDGKRPENILLIKQQELQFLIFPDENDSGMYGAGFSEDIYREAESKLAAFFPEKMKDNLFVDEQWVARLLKPDDILH